MLFQYDEKYDVRQFKKQDIKSLVKCLSWIPFRCSGPKNFLFLCCAILTAVMLKIIARVTFVCMILYMQNILRLCVLILSDRRVK